MADAFGLRRVVEQSIAQSLFKRRWNGIPRKQLEFKHDFLLSDFWTEEFQQLSQWIVKLVYNAFFERNNRVIGNRDVFGTDFRAALRDVAVANSAGLF